MKDAHKIAEEIRERSAAFDHEWRFDWLEVASQFDKDWLEVASEFNKTVERAASSLRIV